jgi:hypothetical protein
MSAPIGSFSQLVTVIRSQMCVNRALPSGRRKSGPALAVGRRYSDNALAALVQTRCAQIARDDPQRDRKAFRVFLEVVLLTHLGEELMHDPGFYALVDDVLGALEGDTACAALLTQAKQYLLSLDDSGRTRFLQS